ncbi:RHS repeat-associated core domain-containing protein [Streptomyces sp. 35G-GA-8]|uniref:RHS repeat-associated core domain-containing protein n=1 Tax=Streptomyces sp. 35G-GA-8 TaxID=2939434 RepID=UPI00201ECACB|nr:RHS repeat-associated core domain-containing protein [Streptomyces sp. 35G-GA-8]MCL7377079.1 polymorphic toxin-type HINT domain-containing protein [Streptomyces sp. 35G-GA-8]
MRTHGELFGSHLSARWRSLTVGALVLALSVGLVSAEAAPPPAPTPGVSSSAPPPSGAKPAAEPAGPVNKAAAAPTVSDAVYAYDAAGRLVGVTDPAGETARYRYDEAGNRLGVDRFASAELSVLSLVPTRAAAGATVTLSGTGFATTATANTVSFGGKTAEVVSATATRLKVKVPAAAGNGKVSVTRGGGTAQSPESFTLAAPAPSVSTMDPASGAVGASVVLTGSGFASTPSENVVRFGGGVLAEVTARTATALTVKVPAGAATGPVEVATPDGRTATATGFRVTTSGSSGEIESTVTTSVSDATPPTASITTPGNRAQVLFDADPGDDINFGFTNATFNSSVTLELYDPQGEKVGSNGSFNGTAGDWEVENLPLAGQYSLILRPGSTNFGAATVTVSKPVTGLLDLTGPTAQVPLSRAGQDGKLSFSALLGDSLSLGIDAAPLGKSIYARLYGPDGSQVSSRYIAANGAGGIDVDVLSQSGTYTLRLDPDAAATGTVGVTGSHYADAGAVDPAAPAVELAVDRPGQDGRARFTAVAGQRLSLGVAGAGFGSHVRMEIRRPDGSLLEYFLVPDNSSAEWDSPALPDSGTYTIAVLPNYALATGRLTLTLSRPVALAPLSTTGDPVAATIGRFGQNAESAFQGQAGTQLSLGITGNTFTETVAVTVLAPSGAAVVDADSVAAGKPATIALPVLPETGSYQVIIDPNKGAGGTLALTLSTDVLAPLTADGPSAPVSFARAGQRVRAEFTAPDTASLGFAATGNSVPQATDVRLIPEGGTPGTVGSFTKNADGAYYLTGLTAGKKYTLLLTPAAAATGSLTLWLSKPAPAAVLTPAAPSATVDITRPGQQAELRTDATAGDGFAVAFSGTTLTSQSSVRHLPPAATADVSIGSLRTTDLDVALRAPLTGGTHRVLVQPNAPATGRTTATLVKDVDGGTLTVGGPQKPLVIATPGGHGHFTFSGTKGQKLTLGIAAPASEWVLSVYGPDGKWLVNERSMSATTLSYALAALPADGLYTLTADPGALKTGTYTLGLTAQTLKASTSAAPTSAAGTAVADTEGDADAEGDTAVAAGADAPEKAAPGVDPSGPDAWRPGKRNLQGQDWITARGAAPKAPPALRAPPGSTALTGHVLKLDGKPLSKVTVSVGDTSTRTDARGRFLLAGIRPEATTLVVEGASANTEQRQYGRFDIRIRPEAGRSVDLGFPVWMTPLDTKHTVRFAAPAKTEVVLKTPSIPGLEVRIPKGSVVRDEKGRPVTELGITAIPLDRPPFPLPENSVVPVFFTVQPGGTYVFPKGAQVIYPNYTREAPGTEVEFMDYDPKKKGWYVYGHGRVSADGKQVVPDAKTRVWAFHGAMFNTGQLPPWLTSWLKDTLDWLSGDPVELSTGMLTDSRTDLAVSDPLGPAEVTRTYWQGDTYKRAFGIGRDLIYNSFLHSAQPYREVDLYLPGGAKVHYTRTSPGTGWNDAVFEPLDTPSEFRGSKIYGGNGRWEIRFRDGSIWTYPQYAPLQQIQDRHGNTLKISRLNGTKGDITQVTTPGGRWISFGYDTSHRIVSARDNTGRTTAYTYDTAGRLETVTDPAGKVSRYTYDGTTNRIKTAVDARGITYMSNTFDTDGRVKEQTLTEGAKYAFEYTQTGEGKITSATVTQPGGAVRRVEFDADGYGVSDTQAHGSTLARKTVYERGSYHRIDAVTDPYGRRTELTYDANGYVTSAKELAGTPQARTTGMAVYDGPYDQPTALTDPLGKTTTLGYDSAGDLRTVTDPEGRDTLLTHTPDGQLKTLTDASGAVTEYTYQYGEVTEVKDAEGGTGGQFLDAAGRPVVMTDPSGARTTLTYDALNQARKVTDPLGHTTALDYDDNGNLTTLTDARNNATTWAYDTADRPASATDPLGAQAVFGYDPAGRLTKVTGRTGQVATAEYDLLGRTKNAKYGVDAVGQAQSTTTYAYDGVDLPKTVTDTVAGTQSFTYDAYDRTKSVTGPTGTVGYDYDGADRRKEMTAGGTTTAYGYDTSGILTSVTTGGQAVTFGLDAVGREKTASLPGGFTRTTGYDKTGTTTGIAYTRAGATVGDLTYTRDERGLQTRLTGSLANIALPAAESGAVFGKDNRLTTFNGRSFTYDAEGQLKSDGKRTYDWNARGELTGLTGTGGLSGTFAYDPLGTRSARTLGGTTSKFLTDGSNPLAEQSGSGETTATVATSGLDEYLTRTESGRTQIYLTDALGTVVGLADQDGTIATRYAYDPYGQPTASGAASSNPYTFTGRESDGTGLLYYRNRYYDPETGRFISQDPIGYAGGTNLYQYALSSPTTYTDPSGNNPLLIGCAGGAAFEGGLDWLSQRLSGRKVDWGQVGSSAALGCLTGMLGAAGSGGKLAGRVGCKNSFTGDTPVLMADGTRKPIRDVRVGDKVLATDPETGESGPREVTALIQGSGDKSLTDITVAAATADGKPAKITATDGHPFWLPEVKEWADAADLQPGQWLRTSSGTWAQITAISHRTQPTAVYNLTVDDLHTYYAVAGKTPVLVHNSSCPVPISKGRWDHIWDRHVVRGGEFPSKSKFLTTSKAKIQKMINRALDGQTGNGAYYYKFPNPIGRNGAGDDQYYIRVVVRDRKLITAFPSEGP